MDLSHSSAKMPGAGWLKFLQWRKLFVVSRYGACFMASFWRLKFRDFSQALGKSEEPCLNDRGSTSLKRARSAKVSIMLGTASQDLTAINSLYLPAHHNCTVIKFLPFLSIAVRCLFYSNTHLLPSHNLNYSSRSASHFHYKLPPPLVQCVTNVSVKSNFIEPNPRIH